MIKEKKESRDITESGEYRSMTLERKSIRMKDGYTKELEDDSKKDLRLEERVRRWQQEGQTFRRKS
jgi:hypothetical protein